MLHTPRSAILIASLLAGVISLPAMAQTPKEILSEINSEALTDNPVFKGFSAAQGATFFKQKHGNEWACVSCHTDNPAANGKHAKTGKIIQPLAPSANPERFTNPAKVAKWFKRNCSDVLGRICTAQEKGDVLSYLLTIKN
jgi:hypothetical protein